MARFQARLDELGATLLEDRWLGRDTPHRVRCAAGHECSPRPGGVIGGRGVCLTCGGKDPRQSEAAFRARLTELGATLVESTWLGVERPHRVLCANGHECSPRPHSVQGGQGICRSCAQRDPGQAEAKFRSRLDDLGATLLEPTWLGANEPHRVLCSAGHPCTPRPSNAQGHGICDVCARRCTRAAEAAFRARLKDLGAVLVEPTWLGNDRPHQVLCAAGHTCTPRPAHVQQGHGVCRFCANKEWDTFYLVADEEAGLVKFGITNGTGRARLARHRLDGFSTVVRLLTNLPPYIPIRLEADVLAALRLAREQPARGREYFPEHVTALVLDIVDHYPEIPRPR